jgi:hypothetical protein
MIFGSDWLRDSIDYVGILTSSLHNQKTSTSGQRIQIGFSTNVDSAQRVALRCNLSNLSQL